MVAFESERDDGGRVMAPGLTCGSYAEAATRAAANAAAARQTRAMIEQYAGGIDAFRRNIRIEWLTAASAKGLADFHAVLRAGILPDEIVPIEDFVTALGLKNEDLALQNALGPYRYFALTLRTEEDGMIGAAGFAVFCHHIGPATVHISYCALLPRFRGLRLIRLMLNAAAQYAVNFVGETRRAAFSAGPLFEFIEVNSIANMTLGDRLVDEAIAMHPLERDAIWERIGFREILGIEYRQRAEPPIPLALKTALIDAEADGLRDRMLGLRAPESVPADVLLRHISAFDNLLMNYEEATAALTRFGAPPDPSEAGLLHNLDPAAKVLVKSVADAARERDMWRAVDEKLSQCEGLSLESTMQVLRDAFVRLE
jgi:GNAT superfamily N-acetyltransferase